MSVRTADLCITQDLVHYVVSLIPDVCSDVAGLQLQGKADVRADFGYQPGAVPPLSQEIHCQLRQIRAEHPKLPVPLHNLSATLHCSAGKLTLEKLQGAAGPGKVEAKGWADLADPMHNFGGVLTANHLALTGELADHITAFKFPDVPLASLPQWGPRKLYANFKPRGSGNFELVGEKQKGKWLHLHSVMCPDNIDICFEKFPYPVERVSGQCDYDFLQNASKFDLVGSTGKQPLHLRGTWKGDGENVEAQIEITGSDIPFDQKLLHALSDKNRELAKSFNPTGRGHFRAWICHVPGTPKDDFQCTYLIHVVDGTAKWARCPYPVENVEGDLLIHPGDWFEFKKFHGSHNGGEVWVDGQMLPVRPGSADHKLVVHLAGRDLCLDGDLFKGLAPFEGLTKTWKKLDPTGRLSFQAKVDQIGLDQKDIDITKNLDIAVEVAGCGIKPSFFPIALTDVSGKFRYHHNTVELSQFTARHNESRLSIQDGLVQLYDKDCYQLDLVGLTSANSSILADNAFLQALPAALKSTCEAINLKDQPFKIRNFRIGVTQGPEQKNPQVTWDGVMSVHDAELRAGIDLNRVTGEIGCRGLHNGDHLESLAGNIDFADVSVYKQPIRGVHGSFSVKKEEPDKVHFTLDDAPVFGGNVTGLGWLEFNSLGMRAYVVDLTASQINLEQFGRHNLGPNHELAGIAAGRLYLHGPVQRDRAVLDDLQGNASLDVPYSPQTRLLNLPLLLDLLKFLGLHWPDRTMFEEAHADLAIQGKRVTVSNLALRGSAVSLYGKGELNLDDMHLALDMYPSWGRAEQFLPSTFRGIPSAITKQLMKIEMRGKVGGKEGDWEFHQRYMPGLTEPFVESFTRILPKSSD